MTESPDVEQVSPAALETGVAKLTIYVGPAVQYLKELTQNVVAMRDLVLNFSEERSALVVERKVHGEDVWLPGHVDVLVDMEVPAELLQKAGHRLPRALQSLYDSPRTSRYRYVVRLIPTAWVQFRTTGATVASREQVAGLTATDLLS